MRQQTRHATRRGYLETRKQDRGIASGSGKPIDQVDGDCIVLMNDERGSGHLHGGAGGASNSGGQEARRRTTAAIAPGVNGLAVRLVEVTVLRGQIESRSGDAWN